MKLFVGALASLAFIAGSSTAAHAHADLTSSNPSDGSQLDAPPAAVELVFNEQLLPDTVEIAVTTERAGLIPETTFVTDGATVEVAWAPDLPGDTYTVAYRVVSNDGHPITGTITFSYPGIGSADSGGTGNSGDSAPVSVETNESTGLSPIWLIGIGLLVGVGIGYFMWRRAVNRANM